MEAINLKTNSQLPGTAVDRGERKNWPSKAILFLATASVTVAIASVVFAKLSTPATDPCSPKNPYTMDTTYHCTGEKLNQLLDGWKNTESLTRLETSRAIFSLARYDACVNKDFASAIERLKSLNIFVVNSAPHLHLDNAKPIPGIEPHLRASLNMNNPTHPQLCKKNSLDSISCSSLCDDRHIF